MQAQAAPVVSGAEGRRSAEGRPKRGRNLRSSNLYSELTVPRLDVAQTRCELLTEHSDALRQFNCDGSKRAPHQCYMIFLYPCDLEEIWQWMQFQLQR